MKIAGKLAVVIGGALGMGRAFCEILLQKGAKVAMGDLLIEEGEKTTGELKRQYGEKNMVFVECNVINQQQIKDVFSKCVSEFGGHPDITVNVAGIVNEGEWRKCVEVNVVGTLQLCEQALEVMSKEKGGKGGVVILMSSMGGLTPVYWGPVYNFTKYGIVGYCRSMGLQKNVDATGVRFNCICPYTVKTPFIEVSVQENKMRHFDDVKAYHDNLSEKEMFSPSYVAEGLVELIEDDSLSGQALRVTQAKGRDYAEFEEQPLQ